MSLEESRGLVGFRDVLEREPGLFTLAVLTLGVNLSVGVLARYVPAYLRAFGVGPILVGVVWSGWLLARAALPYVGHEALADLHPRALLAGFGTLAMLGLFVWLAAPHAESFDPWLWVLAGGVVLETWRSHGPGVTFTVEGRNLSTDRFARSLATTRTFRRVGVLLGLSLLVVLFAMVGEFRPGFQLVVAVVACVGAAATVGRIVLGETDLEVPLRSPPSSERVRSDLTELATQRRSLLLGDTLFRFARGMFYPFLILVVADRAVPAQVAGFSLSPIAIFTVALVAETLLALVASMPATRLADELGSLPVAIGGVLVVAFVPLGLASVPPTLLGISVLFACFGLGVATRPVRRSLVARATREVGRDAAELYRLVRRLLVVPSAIVGGLLYANSPTMALGLATSVALLGCWELLRHSTQ
ncbi:MFS transporter [Halorussus halophilus]|uniref:MFS transporter n=1 Tax=Halorussus halophilus TaxID=2650975 RepID=UPI0013018D95|nr:MFS transporter [Halorussus halophilus]